MRAISPPTVEAQGEDRFLLCQMALEPALQDLVANAGKAGWGEKEVLSAIIEVADNLMLASACNDELMSLIDLLKRRRGEQMPKLVEEYKGYRIAIYSPSDHYAVITPPGSNAVRDFGERRATSSAVDGAAVCLARAKALVDELTS